jgi:hypothetical protein
LPSGIFKAGRITLVQLMPPDLRRAYDEIDYGEKAGRIVMRKPVGPFESMADQLDAIEREAAARLSSRKTPPRDGASSSPVNVASSSMRSPRFKTREKKDRYRSRSPPRSQQPRGTPSGGAPTANRRIA